MSLGAGGGEDTGGVQENSDMLKQAHRILEALLLSSSVVSSSGKA